ncbi:MAG: hypothetical protein GWN67_05285 [Phycisphaerae bacterium]|nr:hypothetical protein [Phycisphaerae bacterium]NIP51384.1 hypothetical protein [Phycisphaerae bacterium]NIS50583.1 hypothetical protein [Phycisphaerae bacterium]NIU08322.1 hypothetical protein [Phycisphaerae bacterium]NIU55814.1 hypothetical protein [Phycisphaerae bacterium]
MLLPVWTRYLRGILAFGAVISLVVYSDFEGQAATEDIGRNVMRTIREQKTGTLPPAEIIETIEQVTDEESLKTTQYDKVKETLPATSAVGKCRLRYRANRRPDSIVSLACQYQVTTLEKPSELKDLPADAPRDVMHFVVRFGHKDIRGVTYRSRRRPRKVKLYLDMDDDGWVSDEKCFVAKAVRKYRFGWFQYYMFGPCSVKPVDADSKSNIRFFVKTHQGRQLLFFPAGYHVGMVRLGKNFYNVGVIDGNFDGRYDKILSVPMENSRHPDCDSFVIDRNQNGKFDCKDVYSQFSELMPFSKMVKVEDTNYRIDIASDGSSLELMKVAPEFGTLDVGGENIKLLLWSDAANQFLSGSVRQWRLPAGRYTALSMELNRTNSLGTRWTLTSSKHTGKLSNFEIRPGEKALIKIGPPFLIKTTADWSNEKVSIGLNLEGQAGEQYSGVVMKNGRRQPAPRLKIVDETGKVLASGKFEYG